MTGKSSSTDHAKLSEEIDIGEGHTLQRYWKYKDPTNLQGFIESHPRPDGTKCTGMVPLVGTVFAKSVGVENGWTVEGEWPSVTLHPSLLCTRCPSHGWIRDGKWVNC